VYVDNARQVFWEPEEFKQIFNEIPDYVKPIVMTAYWMGFRAKELLKLEWRHVNLETGWVELPGKMTKNKECKTVYLPIRALECLWEGRKKTEDLMASTHTIIPVVFHRRGQPIKSFRTAWDNGRVRTELMGKHGHDLRRNMTRHLRDAQVDEQTGMKITGHKTRNMYDRYNIRNEEASLGCHQKTLKAGTVMGQTCKMSVNLEYLTTAKPLKYIQNISRAGVAESADAQDLKSCAREGIRVQFPSPAPKCYKG